MTTKEQQYFQLLLKVYVWLVAKAYGLKLQQIGDIRMNYIVKDNNPDVGFNVTTGDVTDAEGNVITDPTTLTIEVKSNDDSIVEVISNEDGKSGTVHFGSPGTASVTTQVTDSNGTVLASGGDTFTVTTGDPSAISSVNVAFDGLTPVDQPAA